MNCKVMGIVNVTPDSFSDGGRFFSPEEAVRRVRNLAAEGADIVDLGAESTRPGATPISWQEEWARLEPVLSILKSGKDPAKIPLSVDTYHPETAELALRSGVSMINCVKPDSAAAMMDICAKNKVELIFPSSFLGPVPNFAGPVPNCAHNFLGPVPGFCWIDPMVGFGTTREEDLALLRSVPELAKRGRVVVGVSRKRIVRRLSGERGVGKLLGGSLAVALWCAASGASMVRVHDVKETVEAIAAWSALGRSDDLRLAIPIQENRSRLRNHL